MWTTDTTLRFLVGILNKVKKMELLLATMSLILRYVNYVICYICLYSSLSSSLYRVCMMWRGKRGHVHARALVWGSGQNYIKLERWFALWVSGIELQADFLRKCLYSLNHHTGLFEFYININYIEAYKIFTSSMASSCQVRVLRKKVWISRDSNEAPRFLFHLVPLFFVGSACSSWW